ncbi:hypothetical protein A9P82_13990 [Arachidicoccus ginsenosidimutans]|uniref:hypothetical protein n=1 Tax=Arachidicoccus sp. BS20 TaxID=1850526 RepID=UPI0007F18244|nr:hypothetical protein [Arachidicoccus sp. BS20]ANI90305.1 hypothetical protein A9P82_13990 [Arachidicoccus sp. BS20]
MKYAIEYKRELNQNEVEIIKFLLEKEKTELLSNINNLKVIGRCGCGNCPTIMLGNSFNDTIRTNQPIIADYYGKDKNGYVNGVILYGNNEISELEFYSMDGKAEKVEIPIIDTLKKIKSNE